MSETSENPAESVIHHNNNQYDRIRYLGEGSFGSASVYRRQNDCALVVLKEIDLRRFKGEHERSSAIDEARIMSSLGHDHIIKYYSAFTTDTKLIIEMEYASIGSLGLYLTFQILPLEEHEVLIIFRQIVSGLDYLHSRNIVHSDLKMANIFVTIDGLVKIGDFGIAQYMYPNETMSEKLPKVWRLMGKQKWFKPNFQNAHLGTLAYSSPERCYGEMSDFKSDIWSLGCILYELITNKPLFTAKSLPELVLCITQIRYEPIKPGTISPELLELFQSSIHKDPHARPSARLVLNSTEQMMSKIQLLKFGLKNRIVTAGVGPSRFDLNTEVVLQVAHNQGEMGQINYLHSLVYQVRLDAPHIHVDRVNLPQTKRIKSISKGRSHYLVLTYDNIVYGCGSKSNGQLGSCGLTSNASSRSRSARSSMTASAISSSLELDHQHRVYNHQLQQLQQPRSQSQPQHQNRLSRLSVSSIESSTQTIAQIPQANMPRSTIVSGSNYQSRQHITDMLEEAQPTSKPFIINELNHRKIVQVAAGNDFSVFLTKTGIVMTCGDGSSGCLGRGNMRSSFTPSMVESLLNSDIAYIGCGPNHVVAVCGNGRVFSWGKNQNGRLGLGPQLNYNENEEDDLLDVIQKGHPEKQKYPMVSRQASWDKYILLPQVVQFEEGVKILSVFCGDKCTIFIDSWNQCWACGENRFNKLGLDVKRRFKSSYRVERCSTPTRITALRKYKVISCSIGKNHTSFLCQEGKLIVFGQYIDDRHKFQSNINNDHRRISTKLQTRQSKCLSKPITASHLNLFSSLRQSLEFNEFEDDQDSERNGLGQIAQDSHRNEKSRKKQLLKSYLNKSRAYKKMPFECVIRVVSTSKFSLALTNDNRIYFWGTRSYQTEIGIGNRKPSERIQVVPGSLDDCFIKIGTTNSSLMNNIQLLGSDQPIIQAQDPRLIAKSLSDLWILDYNPESNCSHPSCHGSSSSDSTTGDRSNDENLSDLTSESCLDCCDCGISENSTKLRHDAILEPQPIVSLYIPSMYNQNGCCLHLAGLYCFDDDHFYLILDTTMKLQHPITRKAHIQSNPGISGTNLTQTTSQSNPVSRPNILEGLMESQQVCKPNSENPNVHMPNLLQMKLDRKVSAISEHLEVVTGRDKKSLSANSAPSIILHLEDTSTLMQVDFTPTACVKIPKPNLKDVVGHFDGNNNTDPGSPVFSVSQNGMSLDEPRSLSTFIPSTGNHIIAGPNLRSLTNEQPLQALSFNDRFDSISQDCTLVDINERLVPHQRYNSDSITNMEETSPMPSWVRNDYIQCQGPSIDLDNHLVCQENGDLLMGQSSASSDSISIIERYPFYYCLDDISVHYGRGSKFELENKIPDHYDNLFRHSQPELNDLDRNNRADLELIKKSNPELINGSERVGSHIPEDLTRCKLYRAPTDKIHFRPTVSVRSSLIYLQSYSRKPDQVIAEDTDRASQAADRRLSYQTEHKASKESKDNLMRDATEMDHFLSHRSLQITKQSNKSRLSSSPSSTSLHRSLLKLFC